MRILFEQEMTQAPLNGRLAEHWELKNEYSTIFIVRAAEPVGGTPLRSWTWGLALAGSSACFIDPAQYATFAACARAAEEQVRNMVLAYSASVAANSNTD